ncbi:aldo/keto reductase [Nonomuraea turkmeniaca]|uniref:aldo/keto reductase n=1 Tax=Nonomuraea turkmeniaca TaxID=103838 RepID=UPI001FE84B83|nr:aldo/keto reductase [Nonomuraea turkmeniaca]
MTPRQPAPPRHGRDRRQPGHRSDPDPDSAPDIEETLGALTGLVRQGKVRYVGSSTTPAHQIVEAPVG